jgi:hypothetical protein
MPEIMEPKVCQPCYFDRILPSGIGNIPTDRLAAIRETRLRMLADWANYIKRFREFRLQA